MKSKTRTSQRHGGAGIRLAKSKSDPTPNSEVPSTAAKTSATTDSSAIRLKLGLGLLFCLVGAWAYWPTIIDLVACWESEPDYSHGFIVPPMAAMFLWLRRDSIPEPIIGIAWGGIVLVLFSSVLWFTGSLLFVSPLPGWSLILWLGGIVWMLTGWRFFLWSAPSIAFLWFMVPLPFRLEGMISYPLQRIATKLSTATLQFLGQPAISEGNVILLGDHELQVAEACSGLRIFMGIIALSFAYIIVARRPWLVKLLVLASALPIALVSNAARITLTGLLTQFVSGEVGMTFAHDFSGFAMIPFAAMLFALVHWYLGKLFEFDTDETASPLLVVGSPSP